MNERHNKKMNANEAFLGIVLIVLLFTFIFLKFNKQSDVVENESLKKEQELTLGDEAKTEYKSKIYKEYIEKIEKLKAEENFNTEAENKIQNEITEQLLSKTNFLKSNKEVPNSDFSYNKEKYQEYIDITLAEGKKKGMGEEMKIFLLQTQSANFTDDKQSLDLSETDKEYLLTIANAYEYFAGEVYKLPTPTEYLRVGNELINRSYDVATILRKMAIENDPLVSAVWFSRYTDAVKIFYQSKKN
jgi:cell division protein FtsB